MVHPLTFDAPKINATCQIWNSQLKGLGLVIIFPSQVSLICFQVNDFELYKALYKLVKEYVRKRDEENIYYELGETDESDEGEDGQDNNNASRPGIRFNGQENNEKYRHLIFSILGKHNNWALV